jgi:hypothetical protein
MGGFHGDGEPLRKLRNILMQVGGQLTYVASLQRLDGSRDKGPAHHFEQLFGSSRKIGAPSRLFARPGPVKHDQNPSCYEVVGMVIHPATGAEDQ